MTGKLHQVARAGPHPPLDPPPLDLLRYLVTGLPVERQTAAWGRGVLWAHGTALLLATRGIPEGRWTALALSLSIPWARARVESLHRARARQDRP